MNPLSTQWAVPYLLYQYVWENPSEYKGLTDVTCRKKVVSTRKLCYGELKENIHYFLAQSLGLPDFVLPGAIDGSSLLLDKFLTHFHSSMVSDAHDNWKPFIKCNVFLVLNAANWACWSGKISIISVNLKSNMKTSALDTTIAATILWGHLRC